jgi:hypothetical protein
MKKIFLYTPLTFSQSVQNFFLFRKSEIVFSIFFESFFFCISIFFAFFLQKKGFLFSFELKKKKIYINSFEKCQKIFSKHLSIFQISKT